MDTDRNLLFGVLALQMDLLNAQQFAEACAAWATRKDRSLADLLVERQWITARDREEVERLLQRKVEKHGGDVHETLAAVVDPQVHEVTRELEDPDIKQSVANLGPSRRYTQVVTLVAPTQTRTRYSLSRLHAEGGLGRIYIARDTDLNREVALKEIKPQKANHSEARRRFLKEAQVTGQLEHPNIVTVYELARRTEDDTPFYTMRLVRGQTLEDAITNYHERRRQKKAGRLELAGLLGAFTGICQAIAYAHSRGVIHRDLKPENVVLGSFGEVVVLDWGLAKLIDETEEQSDLERVAVSEEGKAEATAAGQLLGTPAYMAPEQAEGRLDLVGTRTDIYGLGAILFKILTGQTPHQGANWMEVVEHVIHDPTPRARAVEPSVPPALDAICHKAMARTRLERYDQAADLAADVQRFLADEPVSVWADPWLHQLLRWARRHRAWTLTGAVSVLGVLFTTVVVALLLARLADQERTARRATNQMREQGLQVAATFAARTIASEIDLRWRVLETEAADPELRLVLAALRDVDKPHTRPEAMVLQDWLNARHEKHLPTTKAASWVLTDRHGIQLGRSPAAESKGQYFGFRDYFHGQGHDLDPEGVKAIKPIERVHRSIVYESKVTGNRMVAFSVPVWSANGPLVRPEVLAVLTMTTELGRFTALRIGQSKNQVAVLVDTLEDRLEGMPQSGLILHHPRWAELRAADGAGQGETPVYRLDAPRVARLEELRGVRLRHDQQLDQMSWDKQLMLEAEESPLSLERDYRDPIGGGYAGVWIAAFEPVLVKGREARIRDTGWVVIVQERPEAPGR